MIEIALKTKKRKTSSWGRTPQTHCQIGPPKSPTNLGKTLYSSCFSFLSNFGVYIILKSTLKINL